MPAPDSECFTSPPLDARLSSGRVTVYLATSSLPSRPEAIPPAVYDLLDSAARPCYFLRNTATTFIAFMKVYHGRRTDHGCAVDVEEDDECTSLHPRNDLG